MAFPQGGDFSRAVDSTFTILKADRRICAFNNGTDVCSRGHKLKFPGTCYSQPIGTFNSTDPTFQPTFPICITDYSSRGFSSGFINANEPQDSGMVVSEVDSGTEGTGVQANVGTVIQSTYNMSALLVQLVQDVKVVKSASTLLFLYNMVHVSPVVETIWRFAQLNPGVLPHLPGVTSHLFSYDVFSSFTAVKTLAFCKLEATNAIIETGDADSSINVIGTDFYLTISGSEDICVGDDEPPFITYHNPTQSGTHLAPRNQPVDFSLSDPVSGVDISTVTVTLNSTVSGTIPLVSSGTVQPGVNVFGTPSSYRFVYTPTFQWEHNERVVVTISGADLFPLVGGNPFFCGLPEVNYFVGGIVFQVFDFYDISASLTPVGDIDPPYLSLVAPASGTLDNSVFTPVTIQVADVLTGVDLGTLFVNVDGTTIIEDGIPSSAETILSGNPGEFTITYTPDTAFGYGSTVDVIVNVADRNQISPNLLATSYGFSTIDEGTLLIQNFVPEVGTSQNLPNLDIEVDVVDFTYGVDEDQTFFVINGTIVSGTQSTISGGVHLSYHPPNDFNYGQPIKVIVHGVNDNALAPVVKEEFFNLFYGFNVTHFNHEPYSHDTSVDVFIRARNVEVFPKDLSTGYFFTTYTQPHADLSAQIDVINPIKDLSASLNVIGPEHRYGETVVVEFFVKDFDGHELGPFTFTYTIEDSPN